jgi:hypothetical protein
MGRRERNSLSGAGHSVRSFRGKTVRILAFFGGSRGTENFRRCVLADRGWAKSPVPHDFIDAQEVPFNPMKIGIQCNSPFQHVSRQFTPSRPQNGT